MEKQQTLPTIAILNTSIDFLNILQLMLNAEGFVTVTILISDIKSGDVDLVEFIQQYDPKVILYDIAFPYQENWMQYQHARKLEVMQDRQFVLTTPNIDGLESKLGTSVKAFEVVDRDIDLRKVIEAVKEAWKKVDGQT
jgi:hypothetical protein